MIQIAMIRYITWKYWHALYLHCLAIAVAASYDMYVECCEGKLDRSWYIHPKSRMSFREFRLVLSEQMLKYNPVHKNLPGDKHFRAWSRRAKRNKRPASDISVGSYDTHSGLSADNFKRAKTGTTRRAPPRLCGDLRGCDK